MKILFIDTVHPILQQQLEANGYLCTDASEWPESKILDEISKYNGVVIRSRFKIGVQFLEKAINLKFIARAGAGMENIDHVLAHKMGIACINAPEGNRNAVAEHALGMLLALFNKLIKADAEVRKGKWLREENRGAELDGKTVGIIGFGNTGKAFAKKLRGFDVTILVFDPYIKLVPGEFEKTSQVDMKTLYELCDIISFHVPLTNETRYMMNNPFVAAFHKAFYLLNTSRGQVIETAALVEGLKSNKIAGVCLNVLEFEIVSFENLNAENLPVTFKELLKYENVILSPHIAGWTIESHRKISEVLALKILQLSRK